MTPDPAMPKAMQIVSLQRIFTGLNPDIGVDLVDWAAHVEETLTLPENRIELSIAYPQYTWFSTDEEMKSTKREALKETEELLDYMLTALPLEMQPDYKAVFEDYLSKMRYKLERGISSAKDARTIAALRKQIEKASQEARRAGRPGPTKKEIEEHVKVPPKAPPPFRWTTELERKLRDIFEATFTRAGLSPRRYMAEYRVELEVIKTLTTQDDMVKAVEELAKEIIAREKAVKIRPPVIRPPGPPRPPEVPFFREEEVFYEPFIYPPAAMSEMRFPRRPAGIEVDQIYAKFQADLLMCGIAVPETYRSTFETWENHTYDSWKQMRDIYELMVQKICKGQPFTYRDLPVRIPYEAICEGVYWLVSQKWAESIEEIVRKLDELGTPATRETVKDCIRTGWREKVPNFVIVTKDYLEYLLAEPLELES